MSTKNRVIVNKTSKGNQGNGQAARRALFTAFSGLVTLSSGSNGANRVVARPSKLDCVEVDAEGKVVRTMFGVLKSQGVWYRSKHRNEFFKRRLVVWLRAPAGCVLPFYGENDEPLEIGGRPLTEAGLCTLECVLRGTAHFRVGFVLQPMFKRGDSHRTIESATSWCAVASFDFPARGVTVPRITRCVVGQDALDHMLTSARFAMDAVRPKRERPKRVRPKPVPPTPVEPAPPVVVPPTPVKPEPVTLVPAPVEPQPAPLSPDDKKESRGDGFAYVEGIRDAQFPMITPFGTIDNWSLDYTDYYMSYPPILDLGFSATVPGMSPVVAAPVVPTVIGGAPSFLMASVPAVTTAPAAVVASSSDGSMSLCDPAFSAVSQYVSGAEGGADAGVPQGPVGAPAGAFFHTASSSGALLPTPSTLALAAPELPRNTAALLPSMQYF